MIAEKYNEYIDIERLTLVAGTAKKEFTLLAAAVKCNIQAYDEEISQDINTGFGKNLLLFCDITDIAEGDRIIRNPEDELDREEYRVVGVKSFAFMGQNSHMEVKIRAFKS
jgi:hypothetical protein